MGPAIRDTGVLRTAALLTLLGPLLLVVAIMMITDNVEAMLMAKLDSRLYAVDPENPHTKDDFGYLVPRDDQTWLGYVNLWVGLAKLKGDFTWLHAKWIR